MLKRAAGPAHFTAKLCQVTVHDRSADARDRPSAPNPKRFCQGTIIQATFVQPPSLHEPNDDRGSQQGSEEEPKPNMPEGVAADKDGNVFGGFTNKQTLKKFVKN